MSFIAKITALLLLALWVPATLHCDLEAAGLLQHTEQHDACCHTANERCIDETCREFTANNTHPTPAPALYVAPLWLDNISALLTRLVFTEAQRAGTRFSSHGDTPAMQSLTRTWSFDRRSALPARAPASVA